MDSVSALDVTKNLNKRPFLVDEDADRWNQASLSWSLSRHLGMGKEDDVKAISIGVQGYRVLFTDEDPQFPRLRDTNDMGNFYTTRTLPVVYSFVKKDERDRSKISENSKTLRLWEYVSSSKNAMIIFGLENGIISK